MCSCKGANNTGFHSRLSQLWESDLMRRQNLAGIPWVMCHQGRKHLLTDSLLVCGSTLCTAAVLDSCRPILVALSLTPPYSQCSHFH